jgi:hypothetical protein
MLCEGANGSFNIDTPPNFPYFYFEGQSALFIFDRISDYRSRIYYVSTIKTR